MDLKIKGKVALVTAASQGIGRAIGERLAQEGAIVVMASRRGVVPEIAGLSGQMIGWKTDLRDRFATEALVPDLISRFGRLDIAVLNTPGPALKPFIDSSMEDWDDAYDLLLRPMVQMALAASKPMVAQKSGSIIFMTSTWVKQPSAGGVLSVSLRSAVSGLAKTMALELADKGVRVNQVQPGATGTERMYAIARMRADRYGTTQEKEIAEGMRTIPMGRWGEPHEIADAVAFLASPLSGFTTGSTLSIDGGVVKAII